MKILPVILVFYVLMLSIRPCCTEDNCNDTDSARTEHVTGDDADDACEQSCSPFSTCGSCTGFMFPVWPQAPTPALPAANDPFPMENPSFITGAFYSIWQPPRLG